MSAPIWLPGQGMVSLEGTRVDKALREYDERLFLGRNENTGDYCVFIKMGPSEPPYPLYGWREVPSVEEALKQVQSRDAKRRGDEILNELRKHNDDKRAALDAASSDSAGIYAEGLESYLHDSGGLNYFRSLRPTRQTAIRRG